MKNSALLNVFTLYKDIFKQIKKIKKISCMHRCMVFTLRRPTGFVDSDLGALVDSLLIDKAEDIVAAQPRQEGT